jgi:hypothetical protein
MQDRPTSRRPTAAADPTATDTTYSRCGRINSSATSPTGQAYVASPTTPPRCEPRLPAILGDVNKISVSGGGISGTVTISAHPVRYHPGHRRPHRTARYRNAATNSIVTFGPNTETVLTVSATTNASLRGDPRAAHPIR